MNTYFENCFTEAEIKTRFRELCKIHHPDLGGSHEAMLALKEAYQERLRGEFRKSMTDDEANESVILEGEIADKVAEIIGLKGVIVELVGKWIWVTGETFTVKDLLKKSGFWWASKKLAWYWHLPADNATSHGKKSLDEIKAKYGATRLRGNSVPRLA